MQKVKLFLHILGLFLGALELILRAGASVKKKLSSMQTTFGTVFTKTFKYQKSCNLGFYYFHTSDSAPIRDSSLIWMAILQLRHLYIQIYIPTDSSY